MVAAVVSKLELCRGSAQGMGQELMPQADPRHGEGVSQPGNGGDFSFESRWVAGTVGQENAVRSRCPGLFEGKGRRHHEQIHAVGRE